MVALVATLLNGFCWSSLASVLFIELVNDWSVIEVCKSSVFISFGQCSLMCLFLTTEIVHGRRFFKSWHCRWSGVTSISEFLIFQTKIYISFIHNQKNVSTDNYQHSFQFQWSGLTLNKPMTKLMSSRVKLVNKIIIISIISLICKPTIQQLLLNQTS